MKDYSQSGEQKIILDYFGEQRGVFLDIGANDSVVLSNSRALVLLGWSGVLVEPSHAAYAKMHDTLNYGEPALYDGCIPLFRIDHDTLRKVELKLVNAAITTQDGPIDLYDSGTHLHKGDVALLSTTIPSEMDRWKKSGEQFTRTTVRGITFATLLKECGQPHFDFISIDAEGMDFQILSQIDLRAAGCKMLCIEYNHDEAMARKFTEYCARFGMKLHWRGYENVIFVS